MKPSRSWSLSHQLCLFSSASCHHSLAVYIHAMFFWWGRPVRVLVHSHHSCGRQLLLVDPGSEMQAALYILSIRRWNYELQGKGSASPAAFTRIHMFSSKSPHDNAWLSWGHLSHCRTLICNLCDLCFQHTSKFQKLYLNQADNIWRSGTFHLGSKRKWGKVSKWGVKWTKMWEINEKRLIKSTGYWVACIFCILALYRLHSMPSLRIDFHSVVAFNVRG